MAFKYIGRKDRGRNNIIMKVKKSWPRWLKFEMELEKSGGRRTGKKRQERDATGRALIDSNHVVRRLFRDQDNIDYLLNTLNSLRP
jgi:hypothetical protein